MAGTISLVGTRRVVKRDFRKIVKNSKGGLISNVKMTKIGLRVWHLQFDIERKV